MNSQPVFIDVNVPMYAAGKAHVYQAACSWVLAEIAEGRLLAAIDAEIIQEVLYRYGALQQWHVAVKMAANLLDLVPLVYPIQATDMHTAVALFAQYAPQGIQARDLIHLAVMQNRGLTQIVSTDSHFDQIEGITRLDPQTLFEQQRTELT